MFGSNIFCMSSTGGHKNGTNRFLLIQNISIAHYYQIQIRTSMISRYILFLIHGTSLNAIPLFISGENKYMRI